MRRPPSSNGRAARDLRLAGWLLLGLALALAGTAHAEELRLGVEGNYTFNSNFFSAANNPDEANSFELGPTVGISDPDGRFRYDIDFRGAYQIYADQSGVDAWESRLRARVTYDLTERTRIQVTDRFRDISNLRFNRQDIALADAALDPNQNRYLRNQIELELIHDLTEVLELRLRAGHQWVDFDENRNRNDSVAYEAGGELRYQVATTHAVGLGAAFVRQDYDAALSRLGSTADSVNAFVSWTWAIAERVTFTASGGPAWIRNEEDDESTVRETQFVGGSQNGDLFRANAASCDDNGSGNPLASECDFASFPPIPASDLGPIQAFTISDSALRAGESDELTFFGAATLTAQLADWDLQLSYQRRQSTTAGDGLASSLDRIFWEAEYAPPKFRTSWFLSGSWDRRETLTDSTVIDYAIVATTAPPAAERSVVATRIRSDETTRDNFTVISGIRYRLDQSLSATLDGRYRRTEIDDPDRNRPGIDTFFVVLTFAYDFDPIQL